MRRFPLRPALVALLMLALLPATASAQTCSTLLDRDPSLLLTLGDNTYDFGLEFEYRRRWDPPHLFGRVRDVPLPDWAATFGATSWAQVFLKYNLGHPAVTAAIPGTTNPANMDDNLAAGRGALPDAEMRRRIEAFWDALPG